MKMKTVGLRYFRRHRIAALGSLMIAASLMGLGAGVGQNNRPDPETACTNLADLTNFPVQPTQITLARWNPSGTTSANGVPLPDHCQIQGIINQRIGIDGFPYGTRFEVRLPTPAEWNRRFMFQGGGGTEGSVPAATGSAGTLSPTLSHGWAVASQNGGHQNSELPNSLQFALDPQAVVDHAYGSIDVTTQTAKFLIKTYYGKRPDYSYSVGCSTGGRQGMVFSQNFPHYFDGIVAGDPVYNLEAIALSEN
jgi:Tannase and feruloyl esterase